MPTNSNSSSPLVLPFLISKDLLATSALASQSLAIDPFSLLFFLEDSPPEHATRIVINVATASRIKNPFNGLKLQNLSTKLVNFLRDVSNLLSYLTIMIPDPISNYPSRAIRCIIFPMNIRRLSSVTKLIVAPQNKTALT
jgi:hypothetical protein